jgi:guanosine-3',5'-bis(diphosphate) 3'-pyrophosphohydrolase
MNIVNEAAKFAAAAHSGQTRASTKAEVPYYAHCLATAGKVAEYSNDPEVVAAAYLHDTLEDTDTTAADLEAAFGKRVLGLVLEVTSTEATTAERQAAQVAQIGTLSPEAQLIKLADQLSNARDILAYAPPWSDEKVGNWDAKAEALACGAPLTPSTLAADVLAACQAVRKFKL